MRRAMIYWIVVAFVLIIVVDTVRRLLLLSHPEPEGLTCPVCGYYCTGNGGAYCIDKPFLIDMR